MIRCEHCGSALPDGAIFCGECGRAVTTSAARRTAPVEAVDRTTPPPLQQPDAHGRAPETADDAWLPESTLDPATRAWLTGADRSRPAAGPDTQDLTPRSAPTHVHGAGTGLGDWTGRPAAGQTPAEPTLDPEAFPAEDVAPQDDPEVQRTAAWAPAEPRSAEPWSAESAARAQPAESAAPPVWEPQSTPAAPPAGPSWWIGRAPSAAVTDASAPTDDDAPARGADDVDDAPRPGDTAAFQPIAERRAPRPAPLVAPGSQSATCHVCGHALEPDDIFCEECGSVRPAVTAAFTGPVMPLPLTRPDWAADEEALRSAVSDAHQLTDDDAGADGLGADRSGGDTPLADEPSDDEPVDQDGADGPDGPDGADGSDESAADERASDERATDERPSDQRPSDDAAAGAPAADDAAGASVSDAPATDAAPDGGPERDDRDEAAVDREARTPSAAPLPPVSPALPETPKAAPLPPVHRADEDADTSSAEDEDEDVEATRIVSKTAEPAPFLLHFSTGERLGVRGSALLGRLPRPEVGERFDDLLTIRDPGKSVSKTHLELGRDGNDLWVSDRHSGNGTVIRHIDGSIRRCEPGHRYRVERGARVDVGEQFFLLQ
ncbi:zinc-ribbon domain-containing protein [Curtobacterium herbarum]|uniref:FHA domain-containing protein n=1 Tax=Curtobacterium herbarum TaxID=150122 RepID=A0ABN1ZA57_9MICO|nr:zinc-ribbon domain-containing protein [Curtobacterium herbarum]MBM7475245.1 putative nucleic acid-binding Zn ribbon protein [Curtobacterium herbarum]MCS6543161.1 FHA domain-containing protein [Curtobacterium herbarum]